MLYKTTITVSFFMGIALTAAGMVSLKRDVAWKTLIADKHWARIGIDGGNLQLVHARPSDERIEPRRWILFRNILGEMGFRSGANGRWKWKSLIIPLWMIVSLLFIQPALAFIRGPLRRVIRRRRNQCLVCGYSRIGNETGICPECGHTVPFIRTEITYSCQSP